MSLSIRDCFSKNLEDFLKIKFENISKTVMSEDEFQFLQKYYETNPRKYDLSVDCGYCSMRKFCMDFYEVEEVEDVVAGSELEYSCFYPEILGGKNNGIK